MSCTKNTRTKKNVMQLYIGEDVEVLRSRGALFLPCVGHSVANKRTSTVAGGRQQKETCLGFTTFLTFSISRVCVCVCVCACVCVAHIIEIMYEKECSKRGSQEEVD